MMSEVRSERGALWSDAETLALIAVWSEENVQTALDEQLRNSHVFKFISSQLLDQGYIRTPEQCRIRIKGLKRKYTLAKDSIKRGCSASGRKICRFYEQLDVVLGSRVASERPVLMDAIPTMGESQDIKEEHSSPHSDISQRVECRNGHCSSEEPDHSLGETSNRQFEPQPSTSAFCNAARPAEYFWHLLLIIVMQYCSPCAACPFICATYTSAQENKETLTGGHNGWYDGEVHSL
ncbi:myb/SANT-like DNA-binding domain-containing protein 2 isoform X2 [Mustelus asterias]